MSQPVDKTVINDKLTAFFNRYPQLHAKDGETLIQSGDDVNFVYFIEQGFVRQYVVSSEGQELTSHLYKQGSFFPLILSLNQIENRFYFSAFSDTVLRKAPIEATVNFLQSEPDILLDLSSRLLSGLNGLLHRLEMVTFGSAQTRVANGLLFFAKHFGKEHSGETIIQYKFTHKNLAHFVGISRETTSLELEKLSKLGVIQRDGTHIIIKDVEKLRHIASF